MKVNDQHKKEMNSHLKDKLISMCEMPQINLMKEIGLRNCIHDGNFCLNDQECWGCDLSKECLEVIGRFQSFNSETPMKKILRRVKFSRDYILRKQGGVKVGCTCIECNWLRELKLIISDNKLECATTKHFSFLTA